MVHTTTMEEISVSTVAATATATGHHLLKIEGYRRLKGMHGNGEHFDSCQFKAAGHAWKLRCYPNGCHEKDAGFFSLYLVDDDEYHAAAVHAEVELALMVHHRGTKLLDLAAAPPAYSRSYTNKFDGQRAWWGFSEFIGNEELQRRGFLEGDCLAVRCTITVVEVAVRAS